MVIKSLLNQWLELRRYLVNDPSLKKLVFQGASLELHATLRGLLTLMASYFRGRYDPIAANHGIKRLIIGGFSGEVVWSSQNSLTVYENSNKYIKLLENNFLEIRDEINLVLDRKTIFPDSDALTNENGRWSYLPFFDRQGKPISAMHDACPKTANLLSKLPLNLILGFAFVSVLDSKTQIQAHCGSTSLRQRYHLCLQRPAKCTAKLRLNKRWIDWEMGKAFCFNDSVEHEVIYDGNDERVVLIVDLWPDEVNEEMRSAIETSPEILKFGTLGDRTKSINLKD